MIDPELKEYLKGMTDTIMNGVGEMFEKQDSKILNIKQEILDKVDERISQSEVRLAGTLASKEEVKSLERRVIQLES